MQREPTGVRVGSDVRSTDVRDARDFCVGLERESRNVGSIGPHKQNKRACSSLHHRTANQGSRKRASRRGRRFQIERLGFSIILGRSHAIKNISKSRRRHRKIHQRRQPTRLETSQYINYFRLPIIFVERRSGIGLGGIIFLAALPAGAKDGGRSRTKH